MKNIGKTCKWSSEEFKIQLAKGHRKMFHLNHSYVDIQEIPFAPPQTDTYLEHGNAILHGLSMRYTRELRMQGQRQPHTEGRVISRCIVKTFRMCFLIQLIPAELSLMKILRLQRRCPLHIKILSIKINTK